MDQYPTSPTPPPLPPRHRRGLLGGLIVLALGIILLLQQFFPSINISLFGPILLIIIGGMLVWRSLGQR